MKKDVKKSQEISARKFNIFNEIKSETFQLVTSKPGRSKDTFEIYTDFYKYAL